MFKRLSRIVVPAVGVAVLFLMQAELALACGGLVAPNGAIRLARATTMVAWHNGIEHYLTSFTYSDPCNASPASTPVGPQLGGSIVSCATNLGWIVPLPAVPLKIEEGGAWTLQRLFRETHPVRSFAAFGAADDAPLAASAEVLQQVKVEALNITVLRGSGQAVLDWCTSNGFDITGDTRAHLLGYAKGSPIFMAAKYDTAAARARGQLQGDGAPVLITMPTPHPWVPLEVLALDGQQVQADLYLLTDEPVNTSDVNAVVGESAVGKEVPGAPGFQVAFQEPMNATLYHDLSTDRNMGWVRPDGWLTYMSLDTPYDKVSYDLNLSAHDVIHLSPFGTSPLAAVDGTSRPLASVLPHAPLGTPEVVLALLFLLAAAGGVYKLLRTFSRPRADVK